MIVVYFTMRRFATDPMQGHVHTERTHCYARDVARFMCEHKECSRPSDCTWIVPGTEKDEE